MFYIFEKAITMKCVLSKRISDVIAFLCFFFIFIREGGKVSKVENDVNHGIESTKAKI